METGGWAAFGIGTVQHPTSMSGSDIIMFHLGPTGAVGGAILICAVLTAHLQALASRWTCGSSPKSPRHLTRTWGARSA